jgi:2-dehydropantoate 2-reductase
MPISRIAVLGTGANGAALGAAFTRAGHDVILIDQWVQNVETMRAAGVVVQTGQESATTPVRAHHLSDVATFRDPFDLVVLGLKAYDTRWGCQLIEPLLASDGLIVGMQNGMTVETMSEVAGAHRTLGCVIEVAANMFVPGVVQQQAPLWFALGAPAGGPQDRAAEVADVFATAGTATISEDIISAKWMKLVANASELVTSALLDLPLAEAIAVPGMFEFMLAAGEEAARAAVATGSRIVPIFGMADFDDPTPEQYARRLLEAVLDTYTLPDTLTTVLQDWRKGRRAEIEEINGHVVRAGQDVGVPAPANGRVVELARLVEAGELVAHPRNAALMLGAQT